MGQISFRGTHYWTLYIEWPEDPPDELLAMIQFAGTPALKEGPVSRVQRHILHSGTTTSRKSAVNGNRTKWELPSNRLPQIHHSAEKQTVIRMQVDALLKLGVIEESRATQVHPVLQSPGKWRLTLDFVRLKGD